MARLNFKLPSFEMTPLDVASSFIAAGIPCFPCREQDGEGIDHTTGEIVDFPEKSPLTAHGLKDATTSPRIINIWFSERHPAAVIGIPTGQKLGGWVLDLDRHGDRDGHKWLADMEKLHGPLPETARATTANGGTHIFFAHEPGVRNRAAIAPGVDTRGEGGYIVGPGSVMADGRRYAWVDHDGEHMPEFSPAPQWLLDLVLPKVVEPVEPQKREYTYQPEDTGAARYASRAFEMEMDKLASAPQGQRGQQLFASACSIGELVAGGYISRSEAEDGLLDAARSNGLMAKDGERQCRDKIKRGLDKTANSPRQIPEREHGNDNTRPVDPATINALVEKSRKKVKEGEAAITLEPTPEPVDALPKVKSRFDLTWFDEIEEGKPKETILKGWLGVGEFTTISGLPGTGKSVVTTDLACHIAAGIDWHGIKVQQGLVVYVAAERKKLTERRMMAFRMHHGVKDVPLLVVGGMLDFTRDEKDAEAIIGVIREAETITGHKCVWVIVDTLTRVFGQGDQNASKDMVKFVRSCDLILTETGAHVTAIHHSAWSGERGKGAIDLDGAVDASFMVKKDGNRHKLVCDGTNDGEEGDVLAFTMKSVQIGVNEDGEPTTAPVVEASKDADVSGMVETRTHKDRSLAILVDMMADGERPPAGVGYPEHGNVVPEVAWRQAVYDSQGNEITQPTKQANFARAKKSLMKERKIGELGQWVWAVR